MERARLVLIAKGDLLHQEAKLAASGLGDRFSGIEIVSDKSADTFRRLFSRCAGLIRIELGEGFLILARRRRLARLAAGPSAT
jgi:hypothetical protein